MTPTSRWMPELRTVLGALVAALLACIVALLFIVFRNVDASAEMRKEAREAVLLAEMDTAVQAIAVKVDGWVSGELDGRFLLDTDDVQEHVAAFDAAAVQLEALIKAEERHLVVDMRRMFSEYQAGLVGLQESADAGLDVMTRYHQDVQSIERAFRNALLDLQGEEIEHLEESIISERTTEDRLRWLVPVLSLIVVALAVGIRRLGKRARRFEQAESLNRARNAFIASVSHEIRTPLSTVVGLAHEMRDDLASFSPAEVEEFAGMIATESSEVAGIVEDLLVAARVETGGLTVIRESVDLRAEIRRVLSSEGVLAGCDVKILGEATATADAARVRQILRNLLANAARYGGGHVEVGLERRAGTVRLWVSDDGPGIPESDWERIFEPFTSAHVTPGLAASVGLGLTVSRQLARAMGGDLRYTYQGRSVLELILPAAEVAVPV